jgi:cathepsin D
VLSNNYYYNDRNAIADTYTSLLASPTLAINQSTRSTRKLSVQPRSLLARLALLSGSVIMSITVVQWEIDCKNIHELPVFTIVIGSTTYTLTGEQYVLRVTQDGETQCLSASWESTCRYQ